MPIPMTEHKSESSSIDAPATGKADAAVDRNAKSAQTDPASKPVTLGSQRRTRRRRLLLGVLGVLVLTAALWFGIPYILLTLNTVSTDDAFVNGHVTFVAARVRGQISRVLVDDNNRVRKGDVLVELDKEPYRDAVAVKKAAVDTAQADLRAAMAQAHGIEAQAWSRRWNLQHAMEDVENQISLLRPALPASKRARPR
jgi:membrane fusion protein, multidrug efflux system